MKNAKTRYFPWILIILSLILVQIAGCKKENASLKAINLTAQENELDRGEFVFEVPEEIGQLGQKAVLDYLHVFSYEELLLMAEDYRIASYLEHINLKEKMTGLLLDQWSFSQLNLSKHLTNHQIRELNKYYPEKKPKDCFSTYRYRWTYELDEWTFEKCGPLYECIGSSWLPVKSPLCAPQRGNTSLDWAANGSE